MSETLEETPASGALDNSLLE